MQAELQKLSEIINGWTDPQQVAALERDLVLEKLRRLYDAVRFGAEVSEVAGPAPEPTPTEIPLSIDLGEMLVLDPLPSVQPEEEPALEAFVSKEKSAESLTEPAVEPSEPAVPPVSDALSPLAAEVSTPVEEPVPASESVAEPVVAETPAASAAAPVAAPVADAAEPVAPTLFGPEDTARHQHKQRVIMSLYHNEPAPALQTVSEKPVEKPAAATVQASAPTASEAPTSAPTAAPEQPRAFRPEPAKAESIPEIPRSGWQAPAAIVDEDEDDDPGFEEITIEKPAPGAVLGEVINHNVQTLGDSISRPRDVASELRRNEHITQLRRAIGINDKFLLIRDLFDGDAATYEAVMDTLDGFDDLDECMIHIAENYSWNPNSDGAKLLMELLERKFA